MWDCVCAREEVGVLCLCGKYYKYRLFLWAIKDNRGGLFHFGIHPNSIQHLLKISKVIFARASLGSRANVNFLAKLEEGGCKWRVGEQVVSYGVEIRVSRKLSRTAETFTFANMHSSEEKLLWQRKDQTKYQQRTKPDWTRWHEDGVGSLADMTRTWQDKLAQNKGKCRLKYTR